MRLIQKGLVEHETDQRRCEKHSDHRERSSSSAFFNTNLVWGIGPSKASTTRITPFTILRTRSTSPPKSAWPGVSENLVAESEIAHDLPHDRHLVVFNNLICHVFLPSDCGIAESWYCLYLPERSNLWTRSARVPGRIRSFWMVISVKRRSLLFNSSKTDTGTSQRFSLPPLPAPAC